MYHVRIDLFFHLHTQTGTPGARMLDLHSSSAVQCSSCRTGWQTLGGTRAEDFQRVTHSASEGHRPSGVVVLQSI